MKENKGFSLVELIVVIVILAVLIGVTIGGIYQYVNKARINTDINNASTIESGLASIATDNEVFNLLDNGDVVLLGWDKNRNLGPATKKWIDASKNKDQKQLDIEENKMIFVYNKVRTLLSLNTIENKHNAVSLDVDSLPKPQTENAFIIEVYKENDAIHVKCRVCSLELDANGNGVFRDLATGELTPIF